MLQLLLFATVNLSGVRGSVYVFLYMSLVVFWLVHFALQDESRHKLYFILY